MKFLQNISIILSTFAFFVLSPVFINEVHAANAVIDVTSNISSSWSLSSGENGSGTSGIHEVTAEEGGTAITIFPATVTGYTYSVTNSDDSGSTMTLFPENHKSFTITYTPTSQGNISVQTNYAWGADWTISPVGITNRGNKGPYALAADAGGTPYTISGTKLPGFSYTITNSDGGSDTLTLYPGTSKTFEILHIASPFDWTSTPASPNLTVVKGSSPVYASMVINRNLTLGNDPRLIEPYGLTGLPSGVSYSTANTLCLPNCQMTINFTVSPSTVSGTYPISFTESDYYMVGYGWNEVEKEVNFNLIIQESGPLSSVTCSVTPSIARVGQTVTWDAVVSGGEGPFTFEWSGTEMPTSPAPTTQSVVMNYSTTGQKNADVTVTDTSDDRTTTCSASTKLGNVNIIVDPKYESI